MHRPNDHERSRLRAVRSVPIGVVVAFALMLVATLSIGAVSYSELRNERRHDRQAGERARTTAATLARSVSFVGELADTFASRPTDRACSAREFVSDLDMLMTVDRDGAAHPCDDTSAVLIGVDPEPGTQPVAFGNQVYVLAVTSEVRAAFPITGLLTEPDAVATTVRLLVDDNGRTLRPRASAVDIGPPPRPDRPTAIHWSGSRWVAVRHPIPELPGWSAIALERTRSTAAAGWTIAALAAAVAVAGAILWAYVVRPIRRLAAPSSGLTATEPVKSRLSIAELGRLQRRIRAATDPPAAAEETADVIRAHRSRLAVRIHAEMLGTLAALRMQLQLAARSPELLEQFSADMDHSIDTLVETARDVTFQLAPSALETEGLAAALEEACDRYCDRSGATVADRLHEPLAPSIATVLFIAGLDAIRAIASDGDRTPSVALTITEDGAGPHRAAALDVVPKDDPGRETLQDALEDGTLASTVGLIRIHGGTTAPLTDSAATGAGIRFTVPAPTTPADE